MTSCNYTYWEEAIKEFYRKQEAENTAFIGSVEKTEREIEKLLIRSERNEFTSED
ncbi:hypothetical protein [Bacillus paranthracis]|uniref:hypothetical protein n=1 Tax=Bacillus paranthracis TaxID=2026186 RepID=UPI003D6485CE